jgi:hypothetical protein
MIKTISVLAKEFIDGFRKKIDLTKLDTIEIYDENKPLGSLVGIYGFSDSDPNQSLHESVIGYSIVWNISKHSITDVMEEIMLQLEDEYIGEIETDEDGVCLILNRIKK